MKTVWTDMVDRELPLPEYPRPQMARRDWLNLNGPWSFAINRSDRFPKTFDGEILVPFSPETELSGVGRKLGHKDYLWYRREVQLPESFTGKRVLLHFAHFEKQCERLSDNRYRLHLKYYENDETELVIRILSFGPLVEVIGSESFKRLIIEKLKKQLNCGLK